MTARRWVRNISFTRSVHRACRLMGAALLAFACACGAGESWAASVAEMNAFVAARRPALAEILMGIRSHAMTDNDRYVVVSVAGGLGYVQCMMIRGDSEVYCEGRSGFYDKEAGPSPGARAALRGLGFGGDPARGNFKLRRPCATEADVWFTADLMLEALYRAYGARPGTDLMVDAPLVQRIRKSLLGRRPPRD